MSILSADDIAQVKHYTKQNLVKQWLILILYIRSALEQSAVVWHFYLTQQNCEDLTREKKIGCKIILRNK